MTTDQGRERPIDNYPRIRDGAWWIISSGIVPASAGLWFVYQASQGQQPGLSALMAFVLGASAMTLVLMDEVSD